MSARSNVAVSFAVSFAVSLPCRLLLLLTRTVCGYHVVVSHYQCTGTTTYHRRRCRNRVRQSGARCGKCGGRSDISTHLRGLSVWDWGDAVLTVPSDAVRREVAEMRAPATHDGLGGSDRQEVRVAALDVLRAVARDPATPWHLAANDDPRRYALFALLAIGTDPRCDRMRAELGDIPDDTWLDEGASVRVVAAALTTNRDLIDRLACDPSVYVRKRLAARSDVSAAVLLRLAADKHVQVRQCARETLEAL